MDISKNLGEESRSSERFERINPVQYFKKLQSLCFKKCSNNEDIYGSFLEPAEKNCLERCVNKFQEAEEFGFQTFQYYKLKVKQAQSGSSIN